MVSGANSGISTLVIGAAAGATGVIFLLAVLVIIIAIAITVKRKPQKRLVIVCTVEMILPQSKRVCLLTHSVLFLKCNLLQNKLKVEQIVHFRELYIVYTFCYV